MAEPTPRDWRIDVLRSIGAPVTKANLAFLAAWQRQEGGHTHNRARFNWLNTTSGDQYPKINSVGVRAFPNYQVGIQRTVDTIRNGRYRNLEAALRLGNPTDPSLLPAISGDLQTWVSGRRSGNPEYAKKVLVGTAQRNPGGGGIGGALHEGWGFISSPENLLPGGPAAHAGRDIIGWGADKAGSVPVVGGALGALDKATDVVTAPIDAAKAAVGTLRWVGGNWDRILYVFGGAVLLIIGLIILARSASGRPDRIVVSGAGAVANRIQYGPANERLPAKNENLRKTRSVTLAGDQPAPSRRPAVSSQDAGDIPF